MNLLSDDILDTIHKYKHQLEMSDVFNELMQHKINCRYNNITIEMLQYMYYVDEYYNPPKYNIFSQHIKI